MTFTQLREDKVEQELLRQRLPDPSHEKELFLPVESTMNWLGNVLCNNTNNNNLTNLKAFYCENKELSHIL